jgi:ribulose kinase
VSKAGSVTHFEGDVLVGNIRRFLAGEPLDASFDGLCRLYWRACVGIALGVRQILDALNDNGYVIDTLHVTGGHTKNPLLMELYADVTGCTVTEPVVDEAVLLGTGMVAAVGAGLYPTLGDASRAMRQDTRAREPNATYRPRFDRDYRIFLEMQKQRKALEEMG